MIVTMLCHTITAYTLRRAQAKSLLVLEDTSFFRNKIRPVHSISGSGPETRYVLKLNVMKSKVLWHVINSSIRDYIKHINREISKTGPRKRSNVATINLVNGAGMDITNTSFSGYKSVDDDTLAWPKKVNRMGNIFVNLYVVLFNVVFWWICINEYLQPADNYI